MPRVDEEVWSIVERRYTDTNEDALFPELPPGGPDSKRGWTTSKRFTGLRRKVLGDTGRELDFHSLRRSDVLQKRVDPIQQRKNGGPVVVSRHKDF